MVEPTKVCSRCKQRKPWSQFHAKVKWDDGTMRQPQSRCKRCQLAAQKANREPQRRYDRKKYQEIRSHPERWAARLEDMRFQYRARRGVTHVSRREFGVQLLPAEPFAGWLRWVMERDGASRLDLAGRFGIADRTIRSILNGTQATVMVETVERALIADDVVTFGELYAESVAL